MVYSALGYERHHLEQTASKPHIAKYLTALQTGDINLQRGTPQEMPLRKLYAANGLKRVGTSDYVLNGVAILLHNATTGGGGTKARNANHVTICTVVLTPTHFDTGFNH